jgi:hypothetical protein
MTYGRALLAADRRRLNATTAIGLDETSFVKLCTRRGRSYATTVADVANHQIIEILPTRSYVDVAGWIDQLGDPSGEVALGYRVTERLREFYRATDIEAARAMLSELIEHCLRPGLPPELNKLARTLKAWFAKICNFHIARVSKRTH